MFDGIPPANSCIWMFLIQSFVCMRQIIQIWCPESRESEQVSRYIFHQVKLLVHTICSYKDFKDFLSMIDVSLCWKRRLTDLM